MKQITYETFNPKVLPSLWDICHLTDEREMRGMRRATALGLALLSSNSRDTVLALPSLQDLQLPLQRVAFGSCNDQSIEQPLWPLVLENGPQLWIWTGDAIYGDYKERTSPFSPFRVWQNAHPAVLQAKYALQMTNPGYSSLVQRVPVIGVWDDHDYGINDGDRNYPYRQQSQQLFLDFLGEASDSPRRRQDGVYASYTVGSGEQTVKFILLDVRHNKDSYEVKGGDFLGKSQWAWLEQELKTSSAAFNVIVSGVQILPQDRVFQGENWNRFPEQRQRLLNVIFNANVKGVILLSGDVHYAEINQVYCDEYTTILTEITSSGMTHSWGGSGAFDSLIFRASNVILPSDFRSRRQDIYGLINFGEIVFDWEATPLPKATVSVRGADGTIKLQHTFTSHYTEHASEDSARTCRPIHESFPLVIALRRLIMVGFVGLLVGSIVSTSLASLWILVKVFRRAFYFMWYVRCRGFDRRYEKLE